VSRGPGPLFLATALSALASVAWLDWKQAPLRAGLELDAQHHIAAVRELAKGEFPPRHNLVAGYLPQGHYGPYLVLLGVISRLTGAAPLGVLYLAGLANLAGFLVLARAVAERLVGEGSGRWAALATLLLWGPWPSLSLSWPARGWPGSTSIADVQNFFYPQQAGLVLLLLVLLLLLPDATGRLAPALWFAALLASALLIASHPLTGLALVPMLAALAIPDRLGGSHGPGRTTLLVLLPLAALLVASLWPYYPVLGLLDVATLPGLRIDPLPAALGAAGAAPPSPPSGVSLPLVGILGPSLVGLLGLAWLLRSRRPFLPAWFAANLALASIPLLPLRHRFVFFAALPLQLAACGVLERAWQRGRVWRVLALGLLLTGTVSVEERLRWLLSREVPDLSFVARLTPESAVILSDQTTSNGIAGLAGRKVVAPQNPDLFLVAAGGWQRVLDVRRFLAKDATASERDALLERWAVTHVVVDRLAPGAPDLPYPVLQDQGGYRLYSRGPNGLSPLGPSPP
jgi:hypothetical protein